MNSFGYEKQKNVFLMHKSVIKPFLVICYLLRAYYYSFKGSHKQLIINQ